MFKRIVCVILCLITVLLSGCGIEYYGEKKDIKKFKGLISDIKKETNNIDEIYVGDNSLGIQYKEIENNQKMYSNVKKAIDIMREYAADKGEYFNADFSIRIQCTGMGGPICLEVNQGKDGSVLTDLKTDFEIFKLSDLTDISGIKYMECDRNIGRLPASEDLEELKLPITENTDVEFFSEIPNLKKLDFGTTLTNVEFLTNCKLLSELNIRVNIADFDYTSLYNLTSLKILNLSYQEDDFDEADKKALQEHLPDCEITCIPHTPINR